MGGRERLYLLAGTSILYMTASEASPAFSCPTSRLRICFSEVYIMCAQQSEKVYQEAVLTHVGTERSMLKAYRLSRYINILAHSLTHHFIQLNPKIKAELIKLFISYVEIYIVY